MTTRDIMQKEFIGARDKELARVIRKRIVLQDQGMSFEQAQQEANLIQID